MKPLFIVNPRSGGGRTGRVFDNMRGSIEKIVGPIDVAFTERQRHAADIAKEAAVAGRETVVAVGGDGSIHEVTCGLMQAVEAAGAAKSATRLGVLGQGTGGDFRRTIGIEHRLDRYCEVIAGGKTRDIDVGRFSYQALDGSQQNAHFTNILSVGMGGLVDRYVADMGRSMGGTAAYLFASLRGILESVEGRLKVTVRHAAKEQLQHMNVRLIAICNGRFFGSGMEVAPMADPADGRFEVITMGGPKMSFILTLPRVYSGKHLSHPDASHFPCDHIEIELENESAGDRFLLDVDGEPLGKLPITIDLVPSVLPVLVP
ncbi:MAG: diacylglycerol kinase family lipid kinase [Polyangiaceae bacterium]|nr:diacylglycerol kinase family lipid kinase [Polyangiaceae bacterium]